jgi:ketosteroid isomerase-like protein
MHGKGLIVAAAAFACVQPVFAGTSDASRDARIAALLEQRLQDWENAVHDGDADTVGAIEDPDWRSVGSTGNVSGREADLADLKAGRDKHARLELGPADVKVLSDTIAVVQSTGTERRDTGSAIRYAFMDVFVKGPDGWRVVRSLSTQWTEK